MASALSAVMTAVIVRLRLENQTGTGKTSAAGMEASETNFVATHTTPHKARAVKHANGAQASTTPPEVAMPLPPLKLSQQVKLCPRMAATPEASARYSRCDAAPGNNCTASNGAQRAAAKPFSASARRTTVPAV